MRKGREHDVQERQERSWSQMEIQQILRELGGYIETKSSVYAFTKTD